ncbi:MAG TPA: aminotransferase class I/II-fold pyridoxal phosphate-dependent enzyme [Nitrososphaerales archaeon]|nr:aminotransferase class I/II-fold pyridoxal phosphate-dependent enzyme [Nitrososphaerales archaeon]
MSTLAGEINQRVEEHFSSVREEEFVPGKTPIPLAIAQFGAAEVIEAIDSLMTTYVTMGKKVMMFEQMFAEYVGLRRALMVNSGSSANLLALSVLGSKRYSDRIKPGDEVICPAVTWPTTVNPVLSVGAKPVFVDVELENFGLSADKVEEATTRRTKVVMAVHLMGNPCEVDKILGVTDRRGIHLIEDSCEAHGAKIGNKHVGGFGTCGTFSFFLSHHITTIEGGMIVSNNDEFMDLIASQRAHGWIREMKNRQAIAAKYGAIDNKFLFYETGFNLRPTEIQGAFGIHQLPRLDGFVEFRRQAAKRLNQRLSQFRDLLVLPEERPGTVNSYFAYPITIKAEAPFSRKEFTDFLATKLIDSRQVAGGNLTEQPSATLYEHRMVGPLTNSKLIMRNSFFIGLHQGIHREHEEYIAKCMEEFITSRTQR